MPIKSGLPVRGQRWKFYVVAICWPAYIFFLPAVYARFGLISVIFMIFPGVFLFTWSACLMHECWHKYVPNVPNGFFYKLFSYYCMTDPQIYRLVHGYHHSQVNTWDDTEFHPLGEIKNRFLSRAYNFFEITLGVIFTFGFLNYVVPRHERYRRRYRTSINLFSYSIIAAFYVCAGYLSAIFFGLQASQVVIPFLLSFWLDSMFIHHTQLIEHGGLIVDGDLNARNLATRNLRYKTLSEKIFLLITHHDSRTHVLHHTAAAVYYRPFPALCPMPENSVIISFRQYLGILWQMVVAG